MSGNLVERYSGSALQNWKWENEKNFRQNEKTKTCAQSVGLYLVHYLFTISINAVARSFGANVQRGSGLHFALGVVEGFKDSTIRIVTEIVHEVAAKWDNASPNTTMQLVFVKHRFINAVHIQRDEDVDLKKRSVQTLVEYWKALQRLISTKIFWAIWWHNEYFCAGFRWHKWKMYGMSYDVFLFFKASVIAGNKSQEYAVCGICRWHIQ